ncbi:helix-turn-helix transcriptional regulator [Dyella sp. 2YAF14]
MDELTEQMRLATAIRRRRERLEFSQESFADFIGMHRAQYSELERGKRNPTIQTLIKVARGLETTIAKLAASAKI